MRIPLAVPAFLFVLASACTSGGASPGDGAADADDGGTAVAEAGTGTDGIPALDADTNHERGRDTSRQIDGDEPEAGMSGDAGTIQEAGPSVEIFVSPDVGADDGPGSLAKPFRTLEHARDVVRALVLAPHGPITVYLRGGRHQLSRTLELSAADSGTASAPIRYVAYAGESPVVSGGVSISGWAVDASGRWMAALTPGVQFRQLYVGGHRAQRARGPAPTLTGSWGPTDIWPAPPPAGYFTADLWLAGWKRPGDLEFGYLSNWSHRICPVADVVAYDGVQLALAMKQPCFFLGLRVGGDLIDLQPLQQPDYMENALELLDQPGEWYLDWSAGTLYYVPLPGDNPLATEVIAPVLERLLQVRGSLDAPVHHISFRGITFAHATWLRPGSELGHIDIQANFTPDPDPAHGFWQNGKLMMVHNQALKSPAAVLVSAAHAIEFERCSFTQFGGAGLDIADGSQGNRVIASRFFDLSGTGIQVGDVLEQDHHPTDLRQLVKNNVIANNYVHDIGVELEGSVGVFVGYTDGTVIAHNELAHLPYTGISVGWGWGDEDVGGGMPPTQPVLYTTPTTSANNRIEHNQIHHVMQRRFDGGGIYTLGEQPGTIIRANHVHDSASAYGIYLDEGSAWIEVTANVVHDVLQSLNLNNVYLGRNETCSIHDNYVDVIPAEAGAAAVVSDAGIEPQYRDILSPS